MKDALYQVSKAHQRYYIGEGKDKINVPGVTTVLSVLNKPALVKWANNLGLQGIDSNKYRDEAADIGTLVHLMCQATCENDSLIRNSAEVIRHENITDMILEMIDTSTFSQLQIDSAKVGYGKFLEWYLWNNVEPISTELQLVSKIGFGGTIDLLAEVNGVRTLVDFKTSKDIYDEQLCQVSAYAELLAENGISVDQRMILRIGRNADEGFDTRTIDSVASIVYFDIFKSALNIYNKKKAVGWR